MTRAGADLEIETRLSDKQLQDLFDGRGWTYYEYNGKVYRITKEDISPSDFDRVEEFYKDKKARGGV